MMLILEEVNEPSVVETMQGLNWSLVQEYIQQLDLVLSG